MNRLTLADAFLDDTHLTQQLAILVAETLLGSEQRPKIEQRYDDMRRNFLCYTVATARTHPEAPQWQFSPGLEPFRPADRAEYYQDTTAVPIPITHPDFRDLTLRTEKRGAIGLDLPTGFGLHGYAKRIMLLAQDPLRSNVWYSDTVKPERLCCDAVVSSPFGLQDAAWRENKRGGGRMTLLVQQLLEHGYGVYLTDCRKFFVYDHAESAQYTLQKQTLYQQILRQEIALIAPQRIVALGNEAYRYAQTLLGDDPRLMYVPHFSGTATGRAKAFFGLTGYCSIESLAECYAREILKGL